MNRTTFIIPAKLVPRLKLCVSERRHVCPEGIALDLELFVGRWINGNLLLEMTYKLDKLGVFGWFQALSELHYRKRDVVVWETDPVMFVWTMNGQRTHGHVDDFLNCILRCELSLDYLIEEFELERVLDLSDEVLFSHSEGVCR